MLALNGLHAAMFRGEERSGTHSKNKLEFSHTAQIEELFDTLEDWNHQIEHSEFRNFLAELLIEEPQP